MLCVFWPLFVYIRSRPKVPLALLTIILCWIAIESSQLEELLVQVQLPLICLGIRVEYFLVHGSNFTAELVFKWRGGEEFLELDPIPEKRLIEQGILHLVAEPVSAIVLKLELWKQRCVSKKQSYYEIFCCSCCSKNHIIKIYESDWFGSPLVSKRWPCQNPSCIYRLESSVIWNAGGEQVAPWENQSGLKHRSCPYQRAVRLICKIV
jgi:hypothetical protein